MFYTSASWLMKTIFARKGPSTPLNLAFRISGLPNILLQNCICKDAKSLRYNGKAGAWQFSSKQNCFQGNIFDHSVDYTGRFTATQNPQPIQQ